MVIMVEIKYISVYLDWLLYNMLVDLILNIKWEGGTSLSVDVYDLPEVLLPDPRGWRLPPTALSSSQNQEDEMCLLRLLVLGVLLVMLNWISNINQAVNHYGVVEFSHADDADDVY